MEINNKAFKAWQKVNCEKCSNLDICFLELHIRHTLETGQFTVHYVRAVDRIGPIYNKPRNKRIKPTLQTCKEFKRQ